MTLATDVTRALDCYLDSIDGALPGYLQGLYLVGSVALGDYREGISNVDFVAVGADQPVGAGLDALQRAHARVRQMTPTPDLAGIYVTWDELADSPARAGEGPQVTRRGIVERGFGDRHPVTWQTLVQCGHTVRGPQARRLQIWTDEDALRSWILRTLGQYWWHHREAASKLVSRPGVAALGDAETTWSVLGITRVHYTLEHSRIASKTTAGEYALETFGEPWHPIVKEALRIRAGGSARSSYRSRFARRRDVLAYTGMVISDAQKWWPQSAPLWIA